MFEARANLIWSVTTPQARRGHFAMGVGLEAGLTIDAMAEELGDLIDRADAASLPGDVDELADALAVLGERLLVMRPFIPDKKNALPANWKAILKQMGVGRGGLGDRTAQHARRGRGVHLSSGLGAGSHPNAAPDFGLVAGHHSGWRSRIPGNRGAAVHDVDVDPGGLPSRRAAIAAIESTNPVFVTPAEMRAWLESDEITAFTDAGDWPTPDTAALWARFRTEALSGGIQKWSIERYKRLLDVPARSAPPAGLYRIVTDEGDGRTWLATPDYRRVAPFKKPAVDPKPSLFSGKASRAEQPW